MFTFYNFVDKKDRCAVSWYLLCAPLPLCSTLEPRDRLEPTQQPTAQSSSCKP
jgi:hypothetical protein